jgi:hypothetical protein
MFCFRSLLWKFSQEALLLVTHHPLPASAGIWADGFWQIVSIKEPTTFKGHRFGGLFIFALSIFDNLPPGAPVVDFTSRFLS